MQFLYHENIQSVHELQKYVIYITSKYKTVNCNMTNSNWFEKWDENVNAYETMVWYFLSHTLRTKIRSTA